MSRGLWMDAASFAARAHESEKRRDGVTPYVAHPFRVAMIVRQVFGCDDEACLAIALLHDVIEDTPADYDDLLEAFGPVVADGVAALTKDMRLREDLREPAYDAQIAAAGWRAKLVKLADTVDNLVDSAGPVEKAVARCERAIGIAAGDDSDVLAAAIGHTQTVITEYGG